MENRRRGESEALDVLEDGREGEERRGVLRRRVCGQKCREKRWISLFYRGRQSFLYVNFGADCRAKIWPIKVRLCCG